MKKSGDLTLTLADDARLPGRSLTANLLADPQNQLLK
jgi:hypothetical protein